MLESSVLVFFFFVFHLKGVVCGVSVLKSFQIFSYINQNRFSSSVYQERAMPGLSIIRSFNFFVFRIMCVCMNMGVWKGVRGGHQATGHLVCVSVCADTTKAYRPDSQWRQSVKVPRDPVLCCSRPCIEQSGFVIPYSGVHVLRHDHPLCYGQGLFDSGLHVEWC